MIPTVSGFSGILGIEDYYVASTGITGFGFHPLLPGLFTNPFGKTIYVRELGN